VKSIAVGHGSAPHRVEAVIAFCGPDLSVSFGGGNAPHIGAVALGIPRPSLADSSSPSASASVLCVTAHKEDELARAAALKLATVLGCRVNVTVGLHVDNATADDIRLLSENYRAALAEVERRVSLEREETPQEG
jgi:gallate decarboxylase subunit D